MKKITLSLLFALFCAFAFAQNGLEKIIVEKYYISDVHDTASRKFAGHLPIGSVTYRIYVDMLPGYKFESAYGSPTHSLRIATTTLFFNNEDKGGTVANVIPKDYLKFNTNMLDSWLSVGAASEGNWGVLKSDDNGIETVVNDQGFLQNENPEAGIPLKKQDGLLAGTPPLVTGFKIDSAIKVFDNSTKGSLFATTNGAWASLNGSVGPTPDNRVLIAQITTDGVFSFELNIQIGAPDGRIEQYVAKDPAGAEILLPSLTYPPVINSAASQKIETGKPFHKK